MRLWRRLKTFYYKWKLRNKVISLFLLLFGLWGTIFVVHSYNQSVKIMKEQAYESMETTLAQISLHLSNLMDEAEQISNMLYTNIELRYILQNDELYIDNKLSHIKNYHSISSLTNSISNAFLGSLETKLYINENILYSSEEKVFDKLGKINEKEWYRHLVQSNRHSMWVTNNSIADLDSDEKDRLRFCRLIRSNSNKGNPSAIIISINEDKLQEIFNANDFDDGHIYLVDNEGVVLYSNDKEQNAVPLYTIESDLLGSEKGISTTTINHIPYLINHQKIKNQNLYLISTVPFHSVTKNNDNLRNFSFLSILFIIAVSTLLVLLIFIGYVKRFKNMANTMANIQHNEFNALIQSKYTDELGEIEQNYDSMVIRLKELMEQIYQTGMKAKDAEMKALQAQINPHFLYNTLDTINWMAVDIEAYHIASMATALGKFFRMVLKTKDIISVENEIELLKHYLYVQKERMKDELEIKIDIAPDILRYAAIKLTLQPIVENSIKHGFINKSTYDKGVILIRGYLSGGNIVFTIEDNGIGIEGIDNPDHVNNDPVYKSGYGLSSIEERFKLYFSSDYSIDIRNAGKTGTIVTLVWSAIPFDENNPVL